jgi:hypothetical protein
MRKRRYPQRIDLAGSFRYRTPMKNKKNKNKEQWAEVITALDGKLPEGGFYDDCPLCQDLKRRLERGEATVFEDQEKGILFR